MEKLTKEQVIQIFNSACDVTESISAFSNKGTLDEPVLSIDLGSEVANIQLNARLVSESKYEYSIDVVFGTSILYNSHHLSDEEYKELSNKFEQKELEARKVAKNKTIEIGEELLKNYLY